MSLPKLRHFFYDPDATHPANSIAVYPQLSESTERERETVYSIA